MRAREVAWVLLAVGLAIGWACDHVLLRCELALNDWAWAMHPTGGCKHCRRPLDGPQITRVEPHTQAMPLFINNDSPNPSPFARIDELIAPAKIDTQQR